MSDYYDKKSREPLAIIHDKNGKPSRVVVQKFKKRDDGSLDIGTVNTEPSRTQQAPAEETDINLIMKRYEATGELYHVNKKLGVYADLVNFPTYQQSLDAVIEAQNAFDSLPAEIRRRFGNDPQQLIDFLSNDENRDEAIKLGLVEKKDLNQLQNDNELNKNNSSVSPKTKKSTSTAESSLSQKGSTPPAEE